MKTTYYKRPAILNRPELEQGHAVIEASAGTGKTFALEHLVLDLMINHDANIEEILVVTFTEAATRELRERIRALIRKICEEISNDKPDPVGGDYWVIDEITRRRLRDALFRFDGAAISTIHGFCHRVLSEQAFLGGRLFKQEHADGAEMFGLSFREELRLALAEKSPVSEALRTWTEQGKSMQELEFFLFTCHREGCPQRCPVTPVWNPGEFLKAVNDLPPAEELKTAGSGLFNDQRTTKTYENHIDSLFETACKIKEITNLQEAIYLFKDWAVYKRSLGGKRDMQIENLRRVADLPGAPDILQDLSVKLDQIDLQAAPAESFFVYELLPRVQARLSARKRLLGLMDFDDMLLGVQEALSLEGSGVLLEALRQRWKYALVDEFQDTDQVQWDIFRRIFVEGTNRHRLFIIGDPKQAIYGFRGADVHTYEVAKKHLTEKYGASLVALTYNFRSTEPLIGAVNEILKAEDSSGKEFFEGLNRYDHPVKCGDESCTAEEAGKKAAPVHILHLHGEDKELRAASVKRGTACFIAEEILRLISKEGCLVTAAKNKEPAPIKLSDIYILTRTGREGQLIGQVLRSYGVSHAFYKQDGLFQTDEAGDVYRLLCAIDSPTEPGARMAAWLTPFFGVPLADLEAWQNSGDSHPLAGLLLEWKRLADDHSWARLFDQILTGSGLVRRLVFSQDERSLTNYLHLFELLQAEAHSRPVTLAELARDLKARIDGRKTAEGREGNVQRLETDREAVQILTMHKAKGLEAEVIFIAGGFSDYRAKGLKTSIYHRGNERCLHIGRATGKIDQAIRQEITEENKRLMYVSLTRAKSRLYLPYFGKAPDNAPQWKNYEYRHLGAFYRTLQKQLDLLRADGQLEDQSRFLLREISCLERPPFETAEKTDLNDWPDENLLEMPSSSAPEAERIASGHRGVLLTSYTRIKSGSGWQAAADDTDTEALQRSEEVAGEVEPGEAGAAGLVETFTAVPVTGAEAGLRPGAAGETISKDELPGGREIGIFLHALIEKIPLAEIPDLNFEDWSALKAIRQLAEATARRHGLAEAYLPASLQLVYTALRTPLDTCSRENNALLKIPGGIASGKKHCTEMSFVYPIPENFHPPISANRAVSGRETDLPFETGRGYIQGLIDIVFEHEGKIYLLDWKSDRLPAFDKSSINEHVEANYSLQAKIYTLAVIRLLGISSGEDYEKRFGGTLYAFIRGIREAVSGAENQEGIWFSRPTWDQIASWEEEFVTRSEWGGEVIALKGVPG